MFARLRGWLCRGCAVVRCRRGNVSIIFALSLIPMILAAGAGIDFYRMMVARTEMSSALDTAALAVGASSNLTTAEMAALAKKFFDANYQLDSSYGTVSDLTVTTSDQQIVITATNDVPTYFIKLAGIDTLHVATSTTVVWGQIKLWVSLVLDNSGSMAYDGKMDALKTAAKQLLDMLRDAATADGDVRMAIVPFNKDVNFGSSYYGSSWLDWTAWDAANGSNVATPTQVCSYGGGGRGGHGGGYYCYYTYAYTWTPSSHSTWNGCLTDRGKSTGPYNDYDVLTTTPTSSDTYTYFVPEQYSNCPQALMPLASVGTSSSTATGYTNLTDEITAMKSVGSTNQTIGLVWGWQAMTQGLPMSPPTLPDDTNRVIILLSDGLNTQDRWYGDGSSQSSQVDARMAKVCANAKADGITIYTVLVMSGSSSVLKACASDESKYFELTAANQITTAFVTIGQQITNLRVAQ